jgi:phenylpropionate dioxygenase-like ring-hydroxylating dioxygenase large terminal subunit
MLTSEDNELLCRVGPDTPMGAFMRQYWTPALLSSELSAPDSTPVRVRLLGENLIAFRDTAGRVGLIANACPHRGASLFYARNEEDGLRCVYHGWKYDVTGHCVDMPSEPPESTFKERIRATAYPCIERGGIVWTYMGPRATPPPLADFEAAMLPDGEWTLTAAMRECNYFQALEGDIDTSHAQYLHWGSVRSEDTRPGTFISYRVQNRAPRYRVVDTDFGTMYGAYLPAGDDHYYWRIACYLFPFFTITPTGPLGQQVMMRAWVPMDDEHTLFIMSARREERETRQRDRVASSDPSGNRPVLPNSNDWYGRFRMRPNASNDYFIDRDKQRRKVNFTGIDGVPVQDQAVTESMGPVYDRRQEHLASSDAMIIQTRQRLVAAAKALRERGEVPPSVDHPEVFRVRGGGVVLPRDADWLDATAHLRAAFVEHPEIDPAIVG